MLDHVPQRAFWQLSQGHHASFITLLLQMIHHALLLFLKFNIPPPAYISMMTLLFISLSKQEDLEEKSHSSHSKTTN